MRIVEVKLQSIMPYSQSKMLDIEEHPKLAKESPADYEKRLWREKSTFVPGTDEVAIPGMGLKMSVDEACKRLAIGVPNRGKTLYSKFMVSGQICEEFVPLGIQKKDLVGVSIWANSDGVRGSGKRVKRIFPYISEWKATATFQILDDMIPNTIFERCLIEAGRLIGIGRFRPEKGGFLGRFDVKGFKWQEI